MEAERPLAPRPTLKWREEVINKAGREAARRLAAAAPGFYLAGGTALALRFGHRISLDLDLFSRTSALGSAEREKIFSNLRASGRTAILEEKDGTCHLDLGGVSTSLFTYPYPILGRFEKWSGLPVASLEDIAAMKLSAVLGRGSKKDFVDLHALCRQADLDPLMKAARRKFRGHKDFPLQAARALVYFDDADKEPMPRMLVPVSWEEIKTFFETIVPKYVKVYLDAR